LKARANRAKSGSVNFSRRLSRRTARKKYRSEGKGRRSFDTAIECNTVAMTAGEETRIPQGGTVRATCSRRLRLMNLLLRRTLSIVMHRMKTRDGSLMYPDDGLVKVQFELGSFPVQEVNGHSAHKLSPLSFLTSASLQPNENETGYRRF
jgi:hypothetical protein